MAEIRLSAAARDDLVRIGPFGAEQFGDDLADLYLRGLHEVFELLRRYPLSGQARPDFREGTRCRVHRSHRVLYRVTGGIVFMQRILHHTQHVPAHLRS